VLGTAVRWLVSWVRDVRYANARFGACRWERVPVVVSTQMDGPVTWWFWWVDPWRGSMPLTTTHVRLTIDTTNAGPAPDFRHCSPNKAEPVLEWCTHAADLRRAQLRYARRWTQNSAT
jgi:hypothetical protein